MGSPILKVTTPEKGKVLEPKITMAATGLMLHVKRLSEFAVLPVRGSSGAAGYDLSAAYDGEVPARGKALLKTDLAVAVPPGTYGRVGQLRSYI